MEVVEYIKNKIDEQILLFLSGEGDCGKTYLLNLIDNMLTMNGMTVQKLGTTGYSANLIDGQTMAGIRLIEKRLIEYLTYRNY
jgi:phage/plasmid-associated DNA primase